MTFNILARSGWSMVNRCIQCKSIDESTNHILIHCNKTRLLWGFFVSFLSAIFKIHWVFSQLIKELLIEWKVQDMNKGKKKVWHWTPFCLFLRIWKEHNGKTFKEESYPKKTFKEEELSDQELKEIFIKCLMKWSRVSMGLANFFFFLINNGVGKLFTIKCFWSLKLGMGVSFCRLFPFVGSFL